MENQPHFILDKTEWKRKGRSYT